MNNSLCGTQLQNSSSMGLQMEDPLYSALIANIVINGCLCYTTIMMNIVTIHALRKTSSLPKPLKTLLLSLAVSDLGVGLLSQPLYIVDMAQILRGNYNEALSIVLHNVFSVFLYLSSFCTLTALSADRFVAIQMPLRYQELVTHKRVVIVVIAIWLFSASFAGLSAVFAHEQNISFLIFFTIGSVCFVATTWFSFKVYLIARRHSIQIQFQTQQVSQNDDMPVNIARLRKSAQSTICIYLAFWVCYLPNLFITCYSHFADPHRSNILIKVLGVFSVTLVFLNSSLNPIIYCWKMRHIRRTIMEILRSIVRK